MHFAKAAALAAALTCASPAMADNLARYDRTVEMAAARRAAERIGELRGSIGPAERANAFFKEVEPVPLGFGLPLIVPERGRNFPPPVSLRFEFMDLAAAQGWQ